MVTPQKCLLLMQTLMGIILQFTEWDITFSVTILSKI